MGQTVHKIDVEARSTAPVVFEVGEDTFTFNPPKMYRFMEAVTETKNAGGGEEQIFGVVMELLYSALPDDQVTRLKDRLRDPDDGLDVEHVVEIFQTLTKEVADRPTLSTLGD